MQSDPGQSSRRSWALNLVLLALFSVFYFALTIAVAQRKPLWLDEILTYHLARLPSVSTIWAALSDGPDNSPPLNLLAVHAVYQVAGEGPVATRLPSILGVWVMSLCLYIFVARRCAPAYAWAAMLFPLTTTALIYACEARPYGLWMGFCGLALICWQAAAAANGRRGLALAGLTLSLAATISSHFYAPVSFIPFGLAELARIWRRRRIDVPMWVAMFAGLIPMAFFGPLIHNAKTYSGVFFSRPGLTACIAFYNWLLATSPPALVGALAWLVIHAALAPNETDVNRASGRHLPPLEEVVAALGFTAIPIFVMILSRLAAGGAFVDRYALPSVIGLGILVAFFASYLERRASMGPLLAIAFFSGAVFAGSNELKLTRFTNATLTQRLATLDALKGLPLATDDPFQYIMLHYYGSPEFDNRLVFLGGTAMEHADRCLKKLRPWVSQEKPLRIEEYGDFAAAHRRFLLFFCEGGGGLIQRMGADRLRYELQDLTERTFIYKVSGAEGSDHSPPGEMRKTADLVPRDSK
jgi:hypothetical protein